MTTYIDDLNERATTAATDVLHLRVPGGGADADKKVTIANLLTGHPEWLAARLAINYAAGTPPDTLTETIQWAATDVYNVLAYGATGDGTTDDTTAVQAAMTAAVGAGGGVVFFPRGVYRLDYVTLGNNIICRGAGINATILRKRATSPSGSVGMLHLAAATDVENILIEDMTIEQGQAVSSRCIWIGTSATDIRDVTIRRVYAYSSQDVAGAHVVHIGGGTDVYLTRIRVLDCHIRGAANAVNGQYCLYISEANADNGPTNSVFVERCEIEDGREGYTQGDAGTAAPLYFAYNLVHGQTKRGALFYHGQYSRVIGNTFYDITSIPDGNDYGAVWLDVAVPGTPWFNSATFAHNVIRDCVGNGLFTEELVGSTVAHNTIVACVKRSTAISAINGDGATVTVTVANANLFVVGVTVRIAGTSAYNGDYTVTAVNVAAGTVQYAAATTGAEATGTATSVFTDDTYANTSEGGNGILVTGNCLAINVTHNRIENNGAAGIMLCRDFGPHSNLSISVVNLEGNIIRSNGEHGIWVDGEFRPVGTVLRIINNYLASNGAGASPYAAIYSNSGTSDSHSFVIQGNVITGSYHAFYHYGERANAFFVLNYLASNAAGYAIFHDQLYQGGLLFNQVLTGLVDLGVTLSTNNLKYVGNIGWISDQRGKVTSGSFSDVGGGVYRYSFVHGLASTPSFVSVSDAASSTYETQITAVDATNIQIRQRNVTTNADKTGSVLDFFWQARL